MIKPNQGGSYRVKFPYVEKLKIKERPAILISRTPSPFDDYIFCMITRTLRDDGFSFLLEDKFLKTKLSFQSEVRLYKMVTINRSMILEELSSVTPAGLKKLIPKILENFIEVA